MLYSVGWPVTAAKGSANASQPPLASPRPPSVASASASVLRGSPPRSLANSKEESTLSTLRRIPPPGVRVKKLPPGAMVGGKRVESVSVRTPPSSPAKRTLSPPLQTLPLHITVPAAATLPKGTSLDSSSTPQGLSPLSSPRMTGRKLISMPPGIKRIVGVPLSAKPSLSAPVGDAGGSTSPRLPHAPAVSSIQIKRKVSPPTGMFTVQNRKAPPPLQTVAPQIPPHHPEDEASIPAPGSGSHSSTASCVQSVKEPADTHSAPGGQATEPLTASLSFAGLSTEHHRSSHSPHAVPVSLMPGSAEVPLAVVSTPERNATETSVASVSPSRVTLSSFVSQWTQTEAQRRGNIKRTAPIKKKERRSSSPPPPKALNKDRVSSSSSSSSTVERQKKKTKRSNHSPLSLASLDRDIRRLYRLLRQRHCSNRSCSEEPVCFSSLRSPPERTDRRKACPLEEGVPWFLASVPQSACVPRHSPLRSPSGTVNEGGGRYRYVGGSPYSSRSRAHSTTAVPYRRLREDEVQHHYHLTQSAQRADYEAAAEHPSADAKSLGSTPSKLHPYNLRMVNDGTSFLTPSPLRDREPPLVQRQPSQSVTRRTHFSYQPRRLSSPLLSPAMESSSASTAVKAHLSDVRKSDSYREVRKRLLHERDALVRRHRRGSDSFSSLCRSPSSSTPPSPPRRQKKRQSRHLIQSPRQSTPLRRGVARSSVAEECGCSTLAWLDDVLSRGRPHWGSSSEIPVVDFRRDFRPVVSGSGRLLRETTETVGGSFPSPGSRRAAAERVPRLPGRHPSPWALGPERNGRVLPGMAAARRRRPSLSQHSADSVLVEEIHVDERCRPYLVVKSIPVGPAAASQREAAVRLSQPKRRLSL